MSERVPKPPRGATTVYRQNRARTLREGHHRRTGRLRGEGVSGQVRVPRVFSQLFSAGTDRGVKLGQAVSRTRQRSTFRSVPQCVDRTAANGLGTRATFARMKNESLQDT